MSEQGKQLSRVKGNIGEHVLHFCRLLQTEPSKNSLNDVFHMDDLRRFVERKVGGTIAPDSPGRILRKLQQENILCYRVLERSNSLYQLVWIDEQGDLFRRVG